MTNSFNKKFQSLKNWDTQKNWLKVSTIDTHTAGELLRIILDGLPELKRNTILEKRKS